MKFNAYLALILTAFFAGTGIQPVHAVSEAQVGSVVTVVAAGVSWYASHKAAQKASALKKTRNYQHLTAEEQKEVDAEIRYRCRSLTNLACYARTAAVIAGSVTLYRALTKNSPGNLPGGGPRRPGDGDVVRRRRVESDAAVERDRVALEREAEQRRGRYARGHQIIVERLAAARERGPEYARMGALGAALGTRMREERERAEAAGASALRPLVIAPTQAEIAGVPPAAVGMIEGFTQLMNASRDATNSSRAFSEARTRAAAAALPARGGAGESPEDVAARAAERERRTAPAVPTSRAEKRAAEERGNLAVAQAVAEGTEGKDELDRIYAVAFAGGDESGGAGAHEEAVAAPVRAVEAAKVCLFGQLTVLRDLRANAQGFYQNATPAMRMLGPVMLDKALTMNVVRLDGTAASAITAGTREEFVRLLGSSLEEQIDVLYDALITAQQLSEFERMLAGVLKTHGAVEAIRHEPPIAALQKALQDEARIRRELMVKFVGFAARINAIKEHARWPHKATAVAAPQARLDAISQARLREIFVVVERIRGQLELLVPELSRAVLTGRVAAIARRA